MIDLRSDTVTRPTQGMLNAMMNAKVGDDVFSEDPSINALEEKAATLFGKEAGVFCPTGTMTNQIAVKTHTQPGDEVIIEKSNHVYYYEAGGIAFHSGCSVRLINGDRGRITPLDITDNINPVNLHHASTKLVCIENTSNRGGGSYYSFEEMLALSNEARRNNLSIHLDGARVFNALTEIKIPAGQLGQLFDSISVCFSKGLGCPVGSVLLGDKDFIARARKYRKIFGGGMRQAGFLAAAAIYALDNHIERLGEDHTRAREIGKALVLETGYVEKLQPVDTNIIIFKLKDHFPAESFVAKLKELDVHCFSIGGNQIRMVTHLDFSDDMLEQVKKVLKQVKP